MHIIDAHLNLVLQRQLNTNHALQRTSTLHIRRHQCGQYNGTTSLLSDRSNSPQTAATEPPKAPTPKISRNYADNPQRTSSSPHPSPSSYPARQSTKQPQQFHYSTHSPQIDAVTLSVSQNNPSMLVHLPDKPCCPCHETPGTASSAPCPARTGSAR
jgi:hypothetical protein